MIIKHGINSQQLEDLQFQSQTISSIDIINNAVVNASTQTDALDLASTTAITSTGSVTATPLTTTLDCLITVISTHNVLIFLSFSLLIELYV